MDSYKTELIADRVWRSRSQLELATVEYVGWFNHQRLHEALGDIPPVEFEQNHALEVALNAPIPGNGSVAVLAPGAADGLRTRQLERHDVEIGLQPVIAFENGSAVPGRCSPRPRHRSPADERSPLVSPTGGSERYSLTTTTSTTKRQRNPPKTVSVEPGPAQTASAVAHRDPPARHDHPGHHLPPDRPPVAGRRTRPALPCRIRARLRRPTRRRGTRRPPNHTSGDRDPTPDKPHRRRERPAPPTNQHRRCRRHRRGADRDDRHHRHRQPSPLPPRPPIRRRIPRLPTR